jgi:hypothetical protein
MGACCVGRPLARGFPRLQARFGWCTDCTGSGHQRRWMPLGCWSSRSHGYELEVLLDEGI